MKFVAPEEIKGKYCEGKGWKCSEAGIVDCPRCGAVVECGEWGEEVEEGKNGHPLRLDECLAGCKEEAEGRKTCPKKDKR